MTAKGYKVKQRSTILKNNFVKFIYLLPDIFTGLEWRKKMMLKKSNDGGNGIKCYWVSEPMT